MQQVARITQHVAKGLLRPLHPFQVCGQPVEELERLEFPCRRQHAGLQIRNLIEKETVRIALFPHNPSAGSRVASRNPWGTAQSSNRPSAQRRSRYSVPKRNCGAAWPCPPIHSPPRRTLSIIQAGSVK